MLGHQNETRNATNTEHEGVLLLVIGLHTFLNHFCMCVVVSSNHHFEALRWGFGMWWPEAE